MAGNMESMLLGGSDDDSSDDSDNETMQPVATSTGVPAAAAVAATIQAPPAPAAPPAAAPTNTATLSQTERLKNLYAQQPNKIQQQQQQAAPPAAVPVPVPPVQRQPPPQQVHANVRAQVPPQAQPTTQRRNAIVQPPLAANPQQQQVRTSSASGFRPLVPNAPRPSASASQPSPAAATAAAQLPAKRPSADPFEPTPLKTMIQRQQQKAARQAQPPIRSPNAQSSRATHGSTSSTASHASSTSTVVASNTERSRAERDAKHRKERFLMFTRVLMKYLEQKDKAMHLKAKAVIRECAEKNKQKEPGYESVTLSMQKRLKAMVGTGYWERAEAYLNHFLKEKEKLDSKKKAQPTLIPPVPASRSTAANTKKTQQQLAQERQLATQQKLQEIQREKEKVKQQAELQKRKNEEEKRKTLLKKQQMQKEAAARMAARTAVDQQAAAAAAAAAVAQKKKPQLQHKRKGSGASAASAAAAARASPMLVDKNREYNEMMQMLDHAVDYDWTSAALLLGKDARADVVLDTEQKFLLYGGSLTAPRPGVQAAQSVAPSSELPVSMQNWGEKNVLSSRAAWARVRLREQREQQARSGNKKQAPPVVGGMQLPSASDKTDETPDITPEAQWFNEEQAEQDKALAVLSEGTEIYLKSILQKAITAARQRENLDGIRLWHLQHGPSKPPISIRLGCDVNRQVAQVEGNAAKTVQRMEEALDRQTGVPAKARDLDNEETLYNATSMADLALRPKLANAAEEADENAKRSFQVYGGKESAESPPFGRVPKKPKITPQDFELAREWTGYGHQRTGFATPQIM